MEPQASASRPTRMRKLTERMEKSKAQEAPGYFANRMGSGTVPVPSSTLFDSHEDVEDADAADLAGSADQPSTAGDDDDEDAGEEAEEEEEDLQHSEQEKVCLPSASASSSLALHTVHPAHWISLISVVLRRDQQRASRLEVMRKSSTTRRRLMMLQRRMTPMSNPGNARCEPHPLVGLC